MSIHDGHRARLDKKVIEKGIEMLAPHEQLEHLLFAVIPRGDTNAIAHRLLERFVTVAGVLNADYNQLMKVEGVGKRTAMFLSTLPQLLGVVERSVNVDAPPKLDSVEAIFEYAKTFFYGKLIEEVYVLSLNSSFRLLAITKLSEGVQNETPVYPFMAVKQAILDNASFVIIAHNHPCGKANPSNADLELSAKLMLAFKAVNIELYDSIVVAGGQCYSIASHYNLEKMAKELPKEKNKK